MWMLTCFLHSIYTLPSTVHLHTIDSVIGHQPLLCYSGIWAFAESRVRTGSGHFPDKMFSPTRIALVFPLSCYQAHGLDTNAYSMNLGIFQPDKQHSPHFEQSTVKIEDMNVPSQHTTSKMPTKKLVYLLKQVPGEWHQVGCGMQVRTMQPHQGRVVKVCVLTRCLAVAEVH